MKKNNFVKKTLITSALCLTGMHIVNKIIFSTATVCDKLVNKQSKTFHWRFGDVVYTKSGKGSPILLIHHLSPDGSQYEWKKTIPYLEKSHTVYALDLLGCGKSDKPSLSYTNYMFAQLVTDFIKQIIQEKTTIITSGSSSSIGITSAFMSKDIADKLIFINPENSTDVSLMPDKKSKAVKRILELPVLGTFIYNLSTCKRRLMGLSIAKYFKSAGSVRHTDIQAFYESAHVQGPSARFLKASIAGHYTNYNIFPFLNGLKQEIFILYGDDIKEAKEELAFYKSIQPAIKYDMIPNTRFLPQMETPEILSDKILDFIN